MRWRLLHTHALSGADNMALDEALLQRARETGEAACRIYTWTRPTLSLGRNQTAAGRYDLVRARALGVDVVRRPTGGRAVLHHRELTYAVAMPAVGALRESYERINRLLTRALALLGATAAPAVPEGRSPAPSLAPCFELPTRDELVVDGRKLVGSAQWREDDALVQHGSILVDDDQGLVRELTLAPLPPVPPPATLRAVLGRAPSGEELARALLHAVREAEDPDAGPWPGDAALWETMARLRTRYLDDAWTWRR
ncbi:MAG TPA: biotin/lipoate A/B protein ligase family protein [Gemmatimonadaceae bacterium]|nr:biotin/lipoate A/B protein ligase family protein [Gemmatimonadaceae bacterium]